jgi:hypothetical protein
MMMDKGGTAAAGRMGGARTIGQVAPTADRGFVATIVGYSPYQEIGELLDPAGAQEDANKWGLVTRLMHLDSVFDGNSPFELYKKKDKQHFEIQSGEVDLTAQMPGGIGVIKTAEGKDTGEQALIDPMTKEVISRQVRVDENGRKETDRQGKPVYQANDHWFVLNLKLKWKEPPVEAAGKAAVKPKSAVTTNKAAPVTGKPAAPSSKGGGGSKSKGGGDKKEPAEF